LEYAFFAADPKTEGTVFCGCDIDSLNPNGRVRYTMLGEVEGGKFSRTLCPTQTDGTMKTIVFPGKEPTNPPGDEVQAGYQIDLSRGNERTESGLLAVPINGSTFADEQDVHKACIGFPGAKPKKIP
jgi:hypothetical protein